MSQVRRLLPVLALFALTISVVPLRAGPTDKYLPNETEAVLTINVKQMLQSAVVKNNEQTFKALLAGSGDAKKVLESLGFDPFSDLESVVISVGQDVNRPLLLVHGKFDVVKFESKADDEARNHPDHLKVVKVDGQRLYEVAIPDRDEKLYVALLDSAMLAASPDRGLVIGALNRQAGKTQGELKADLRTLLNKADAQQAISIAALGTVVKGGQLGGKLATITGGVTFTDEIKGELALNANNVQDAKAVETMISEGVNFLKGIVDLAAGQDDGLKPLVGILGALRVNADGNSVTLKGGLSKDQIERLMSKAKEQ